VIPLTVLDAGCGAGKGALALAAEGYDVALTDQTDVGLLDEARRFPFAEACLWSPQFRSQMPYRFGGAFDYVYCCDVLEHVPIEFTMLAIANLLSITRRGLFLHISTVPDVFGVRVGERLHKTVESFTWWRDRLRELGSVEDARDLIVSGAYWVEPRRAC